MKIIFLSNYFTHHQKPLSDALFSLTQGNYLFLATGKMDEQRKKEGWSIKQPEYVREIDMSNESVVCDYLKQINDADIVIQGSLYYSLIDERVKDKKLTYFYTERLYKSPKRFLKAPLYFYRGLKFRSCYILSASAFTPLDYSFTNGFDGKCYKFGYFPESMQYDDVDALLSRKNRKKILWVARTIDWKHPEIPLKIATRLRDDGYSFEMEMIGTGPLDGYIQMYLKEHNLSDLVHFMGAKPSSEVRPYMEAAGIFLFTSDKNEGWGAVLNESMNSCCAVVADSKIGSVPYLLKDGENGLVYEDGNFEDIYRKVKYLLDNPSKQIEFGKKSYNTISKFWNLFTAANNLITLSECLIAGKESSIQEGPCSKAVIIKDNWYKCQ